MRMAFDPYQSWLGIPPVEQPPHHYRLLGLDSFESDQAVINDAADRQMTLIQTYKLGPNSDASQKLLNELAAARICLLNAGKKAAYDAQLRAKSAPAPDAPAAPREPAVFPPHRFADAATPPVEEQPKPADREPEQPTRPARPAQPTKPPAEAAAASDMAPDSESSLASEVAGAPSSEVTPASAAEPPIHPGQTRDALRRVAVIGGGFAASLLLTILLAVFFTAGPPQPPVAALTAVGEPTSQSAISEGASATATSVTVAPPVAPASSPPTTVTTHEVALPTKLVMGSASSEPTSNPAPPPKVAARPTPAAAAPSMPPSPTTEEEEREKLDQASETTAAVAALVAGELLVANEEAGYTPPATEEMVRWATAESSDAPTEDELREARSHVSSLAEKYRDEVAKDPLTGARDRFLDDRLLSLFQEEDNSRAVSMALLERAYEETDPIDFYGIWRFARKAQQTGLDDAPWRRAALEQAGNDFKLAPGRYSLDFVRCCIELSDAALRNGDHALALECIARANQVARASKDKIVIGIVDGRRKQLVVVSPAFEKAALAKQRLDADPTDVAAAAEWGRHLCLGRGDFATGLPFLAQGSDARAEAARRELRRPADDAERVARGQLWAKVASAAADLIEQRHAHQRAVAWYHLAPNYKGDAEAAERQKWLADYRGVNLVFSYGFWDDALLVLDPQDAGAESGWRIGVRRRPTAPQRKAPREGEFAAPATLTVPVTFTGDYEMRFNYEAEWLGPPGVRSYETSMHPEGWGDCRVVFPVGREQLKFGTFTNGRLGLRDANDVLLAGPSPISHNFHGQSAGDYVVKVQYTGGRAAVEVWYEKERLMRWETLAAGPANRGDTPCLRLETIGGGVEVTTLDVRVLGGAGKLKRN